MNKKFNFSCFLLSFCVYICFLPHILSEAIDDCDIYMAQSIVEGAGKLLGHFD